MRAETGRSVRAWQQHSGPARAPVKARTLIGMDSGHPALFCLYSWIYTAYSILLPLSMSLPTHISRTVASQATPTSSEGPVPYPFHPTALSPLKSLVPFRSQDTTASHSSFSSLLLFFPALCLSRSPKLKALLHPPRPSAPRPTLQTGNPFCVQDFHSLLGDTRKCCPKQWPG